MEAKDKLKELCKKIEIYMQEDSYYSDCIISGHSADRFGKLIASLDKQIESGKKIPAGAEDRILCNLIRFFEMERDLKFCTPKYFERVKWYFETYKHELFVLQSTAKIEEGKGLPTDEEIDKKIFEICSKKRPWNGKSLPITAPEMLNELAQWFKNGTRNNEGDPISDAGFFSDN